METDPQSGGSMADMVVFMAINQLFIAYIKNYY
jgi:hypothetical protein